MLHLAKEGYIYQAVVMPLLPILYGVMCGPFDHSIVTNVANSVDIRPALWLPCS